MDKLAQAIHKQLMKQSKQGKQTRQIIQIKQVKQGKQGKQIKQGRQIKQGKQGKQKRKCGDRMRIMLDKALADILELKKKYSDIALDYIQSTIQSLYDESDDLSYMGCLEAVESFGELCLHAMQEEFLEEYADCYNYYIRLFDKNAPYHTVVVRLSPHGEYTKDPTIVQNNLQ